MIMLKIKRLLLKPIVAGALFFTFLSPATSFSESIRWHSWSEQTIQKAQSENKLILLDLVASWCQFCKKMDETTYQDEGVISVLNKNYLVVKADEADSPELAKKYKKDGRPTTVILNSDGVQVLKRVGYIKPQWMGWMLQAVAQDPTPEVHH